MKKKYSIGLKYQQIFISLIVTILSIIIIVFILPIVMQPIYENNLYNLMEQSLYMKDTFYEKSRNNFIIVSKSNNKLTIDKTGNLDKKDNYEIIEAVTYLNNSKGKIKVNGNNYYYISNEYNNSTIYVIANGMDITIQQKQFSNTVFPIILIVIIVLITILLIYNNMVINKIKKIKENIKNINNKKYIGNNDSIFIDELDFLSNYINDARNELIDKDKEKNELFQQISHELKTPLMIISNHFDALQDKIIDQKEAYEVIDTEIKKLNSQINLILQLTKYESITLNNDKTIKLSKIIDKQVDNFKKLNNKLIWDYKKDELEIEVNEELWNMVISNLFSNFIRYAKKNIKIYKDKDKIIFENDGKKIDERIINKVFEPYIKSSDGKSGLGLYIVKKSLEINNYDIECSNKADKGVMFTIIKKH